MENLNPQKGEFYYHKKHTDESINNFAYEIVGRTYHTESGEILVVYRPLYMNELIIQNKLDSFSRPLEMWTPDRFTRITDEAVLSELDGVKREMYK